MSNAPQSDVRVDDPIEPRSLAAIAAALATCTHPEAHRSRLGLRDDEGGATWCAACGALHPDDAPKGAWQSPALTSRLTRRHFEELVLLLHSIVQLAQLARAHVAPAGSGSTAQVVLRSVRTSLVELARLPLVRHVEALDQAIATLPPCLARP